MIVLGLDTATPATAVAVRMGDGSTLQARDDPRPGAHPGHATRLLAMAHGLLADAGLAWSAIERISVGVGPGTFTGLRVGVATARGLAQSLSAELVGVSSLRALAAGAFTADGAQAADELAPDELAPDVVLAVIDARRGEVFAAAYERCSPHAPHELTVPRALAPQELGGVVVQAERLGGARSPRWLVLGDGALRFASELRTAGLRMAHEGSPLHRVSAAAICELGSRAQAAAELEQILPDYRRRPDAELALESAAAGAGAGR